MEGTNHIFKTSAGLFYCRWSDSAEIYKDYLSAAEQGVTHDTAEEIVVEDFVLRDVQHVTLPGREIIRGTIPGTIPIKIQFHVDRNCHAAHEWSITETFYVINDQTVPGNYSESLRDILFDVIRTLEKSGDLMTNQLEDDRHLHDEDSWKETESFINRHL